MTGILELNRNLQRAWLNIVELQSQVAKEKDVAILDAQREQMSFGIDSTGTEISPSYRSPEYAELKERAGSKAKIGTPDLKLTGAFYKGMFGKQKIQSDKTIDIEVSSKDEKTGKLTGKYGQNIFGLSGDYDKNLRKELYDAFVQKFKKATGLK